MMVNGVHIQLIDHLSSAQPWRQENNESKVRRNEELQTWFLSYRWLALDEHHQQLWRCFWEYAHRSFTDISATAYTDSQRHEERSRENIAS
jgi:hypothetical protein